MRCVSLLTKRKELGLRFDLTLGSGWPFGGPTVSIEHAAARLRYEHVKIDTSTRVRQSAFDWRR